ncbi:preprotein translocase subunit YajC [Sinorhizobium numidicum]|uniref:Sec translocon accessory complex subunit YajC n=1 Tax=Sinorhizobium numidicum TaxID=680248 RepID=A0ABY8CUJ2_9HYPH|nr:preprotein translocase subunit YajC [Sinorhizobium numidicum]WEX78857.1 preprotein translocase subunit YajC [Sinorhizobium numidicum]WEX82254.1 preprotein translocase subunit YajC [Sinorhizobium numidicum]
MFITEAFAQTAAPGGAGGADILMSILPFLLIFVVMYFLIIRPQRAQMKRREELLKNIRRGDQIVTGGGIVGKVTKVVDDAELEVEIAEGIKIRVVRSGVSEVRVKGEPVKE